MKRIYIFILHNWFLGATDLKIGILFQDIKAKTLSWQKNQKIYDRTARRTKEMAQALIKAGYEVVIFSSLEDFFTRRGAEPVDLVFPCIECCFERNTNGFIPSILQMEGIPFIGNDSYINTIASDKYLFENIAKSLGIRTPKSKLIYKRDTLRLSKCICEVELPCILKYQYGSMSYHTIKVSDMQQLNEQIKLMFTQDNGPVLCEEYIEGREVSVPVIGTAPNEQILSVIEYTDSNKKPLEIYDTLWKGKNDSQIELTALCDSLPSVKNILYSVHKIYRYLNYNDYARFDFRLNRQGIPYLLEGNPLPALAYESAFDPISYGYDMTFSTVLTLIIENAAKRYGLV